LNSENAWIQYNNVDFGTNEFKSVQVRAKSDTKSLLHIKLNNYNGPVIANVEIPGNTEWKIFSVPVSELKSGIQNLVVLLKNGEPVEVDWISFE
jgi:hypothetical protein